MAVNEWTIGCELQLTHRVLIRDSFSWPPARSVRFRPTRRGRPCFITASSPSPSPPSLRSLIPFSFAPRPPASVATRAIRDIRLCSLHANPARLNVGRSVGFSAFSPPIRLSRLASRNDERLVAQLAIIDDRLRGNRRNLVVRETRALFRSAYSTSDFFFSFFLFFFCWKHVTVGTGVTVSVDEISLGDWPRAGRKPDSTSLSD